MSRLLADSRAAFLAYPADMLEKSSVFAALAAHGVATVCASPGARSAALEPGVHFLDAARLAGPVEPAALQTLASRAHGWYQGHRAARQSDLLAGRLGS